MEHSGYSPLRKLWASFRAAEKASKARKPTAAGEKQAAPEGTDVTACLVRARAHLVELLRDPAVQRDSLYAAAYAFLGYAQDDPTTAAAVMDPLAVAFETKGAEAIPPTANTKLIEGLFWVDYAWQARTRRWARNVSEEGWRLFGQRLPKAAAALEAAYALDPGDEHISNTMLTVELGQGTGRPRMESWFRRAMDANPDAWVPCVSKLEYVKPRWYGSEADVLAFGRECLATENWRVSQPLILLEAHKFLAEDSGDPAAYWKKPEVWTDVRQVCQGMLATFPNAHFRTMYALYAYRAEQWKLADEQCRLLGEKPDLFGLDTTKAQYTVMCQVAAAKVQAESPAPAP